MKVQFHNFFENTVEERKMIIEKLKKTHNRMWDYIFVLENWQKVKTLHQCFA